MAGVLGEVISNLSGRPHGSLCCCVSGRPTSTPRPTATAPSTPVPLPVASPPTIELVRALSENSIKVYWERRTDLALVQVQKRPSGESRWDHVGYGQGRYITVNALTRCTEYEFQVRGSGGGHTNRTGWGPWSGITTGETQCIAPTPTPTATPTPTYAALRAAPGRAIDCRFGVSKTATSNTEPYTDPNGAVHNVRSEIKAVWILTDLHFHKWEWCVEGRFITESTPGADGMTWGGKLYETTASITAADVLDFLTFDLSAFYALYNAVAPDRSQPPSTPAKTYTCSAPCKGGTLQTNHIYVDSRHIKTKAIYVYGTHDLTIRGETHSMTSEAMHKIQVRSASRESLNNRISAGFKLTVPVLRKCSATDGAS